MQTEESEIDQDILDEYFKIVEKTDSKVSWWTITFSFEPVDVDSPNNVVTVEVLFAVEVNESGEIWRSQVGLVNGTSRGILSISAVDGSCNLENLPDALTN